MIFAFALGLISFLLALILTPLIRDQFQGSRFVDQPDGVRKIHTNPIPRVGGIGIAIAYMGSFLIISLIPFQAWKNLGVRPDFARALFFGAAIVFLAGLLDDFFNIRPWQKLLGQLLGAVVMYNAGIRIQFPENFFLGEAGSLIVTLVWLIGCTNAFNLIDGLDGLATGVGLFATITMLIAGLLNNNLDLIVVTVPLAGSLIGFLRYNFNPASVFLGDCGSMLIGFLLGGFAIEWSHKSVTLLGLTAPMMAMSVPLLDASLSIARRFLRNRPIFGADRGHIHHRLLDRGLSQRQTAMVAYAISGLAAAFSLVQSSLHRDFGGLIIVLFGVAVWIGIQNLGYIEFSTASRMLFRGTFGRIIDFQTQLRHFADKVEQSQNLDEVWASVCEATKAFGFHGCRLQIFSRTYVEIEDGYQNSMQVRIPLNDGNYVNFYGIDGQLHSIVLNTFLPVVANALNAKTASLQPINMPPNREHPKSQDKPRLIKTA